MRLRMEMTNPLLAERFKEMVGREVTAAMRRETRALEKRLEAATTGAGLSAVLAKTWNSRSFPIGRDSITPAGVVWSKAPLPMRAFSEGATIIPKKGRYLAIPTVWNREGGRRGAKARVSPAEMVAAKGQAFTIRSKNRSDVLVWCLRVAAAGGRGRNRYAVRAGGLATINASGSRAASRIANQAQLLGQGFVPMFVLVPGVKIKKLLDIPPLAQAALANVRIALATAIANAQRAIGGAS
jgi:hypothetical protein